MSDRIENMPIEVKKEVLESLAKIASGNCTMMVEGVRVDEMAKGALLLINELVLALPAAQPAPTVDIVEWLESQPHEPTDALREAYADYQRRVVQPAPMSLELATIAERDMWRDRAQTAEALLAAQPAPVTVEAWQPIETAPKDGTIIDLWGLNLLRYDKQGLRIVNVKWGAVRDWMGNERDDWQHGRGEDFKPTHWMPLPEPPRALAGDKP